MKKQDFEELKSEVLDLVSRAAKNSDPEIYDNFNEGLSIKVLGLPNKKSIEEAFKGIIGFYHWCIRNEKTEKYFLFDAFHDLNETVYNHDEKWFSPRTYGYIKVWECVNAKLW
jgi:hypothetical protein